MAIKEVQRILNLWGITDYEGKALKEDNILGIRTRSAIAKAKDILNYILK